jgi:hypothetical protein
MDKFQLTDETRSAVIEYKNLQPLVKNLVDKSPEDQLNAPPATEDAILRPFSYLISALPISKHGHVPKSLQNIIRYLKELYEIKAIVDGFDAKIEKLNLSRSWSYLLYHAPNINNLPTRVLRAHQITFSNPNFIIKTKDDYYTIWYNFSLTENIRPDFFILKGKHETPFKKGVYKFLSDRWRSGSTFGMNINADTSSKENAEEFLIELAKFLKRGLVIESEENSDSFRTKNTQRQLITYSKVFDNQKLLLLSWTVVPLYVQSFDIIDKFNIEVESTKRLTNYIKEVLG